MVGLGFAVLCLDLFIVGKAQKPKTNIVGKAQKPKTNQKLVRKKLFGRMEQVDTSSKSMARIITSLGIDHSLADVLVRHFRINTPVDLGFFCAEMLGCSPHGIHPSDYNLSLVEVGLTATDLSRLVGCYLHFVSLCKHMTVNESLARNTNVVTMLFVFLFEQWTFRRPRHFQTAPHILLP